MGNWNRVVESCKQATGRIVEDNWDVMEVVDELSSKISRLEQELSKFHQPTVIACLHPFNEVVSGDDGDFCCNCQNYLKSNRL